MSSVLSIPRATLGQFSQEFHKRRRDKCEFVRHQQRIGPTRYSHQPLSLLSLGSKQRFRREILRSVFLGPSLHQRLHEGRRFNRKGIRKLECVGEADGGVLSGLTKLGKRVESDGLPPAVRDSTMRAVEELGLRVTVGDVASRAGLSLLEAERALQAIAADAGGFLEVSDAGDVLYGFPPSFRSNLASKSLALRLQPAIAAAQGGAAYLVRVAFGTALLASILLVVSTIYVILTAKSDERNSSSRSSRNEPSIGVYINPFDLFWYWDPYYYRSRRRMMMDEGDEKMNFFQSVFSFVFGDGNPNEGFEDVRWKRIGEYIASKGGVVAAEEVAPFLDIDKKSGWEEHEEAYMLPVIQRLDGRPEVDDQGNILYTFPSLQKTASKQWWPRWSSPSAKSSPDFLSENKWTFSEATAEQKLLTGLLGFANLVGVLYLTTVFKDPRIVRQVGSELVTFVYNIMPGLVAYATSFFAIPSIRYFLLQRKNAEIEERNNARLRSALVLSRPNPELQKKIANARTRAERTILSDDRVVYSSKKDLSEQDYEVAEFDRRLRDAERKNGG